MKERGREGGKERKSMSGAGGGGRGSGMREGREGGKSEN